MHHNVKHFDLFIKRRKCFLGKYMHHKPSMEYEAHKDTFL